MASEPVASSDMAAQATTARLFEMNISISISLLSAQRLISDLASSLVLSLARSVIQ
jgi:hypothetical protein